MADKQTYQNHVRYFPIFHFVLVPILTLNLLYQSVQLYQEPSLDRTVWVILAFTFILMILAARAQALKVQDRVIRMEEQLRYKEILSPELNDRSKGLRLGQIIALRFASDAELPSLVERTLNGEFSKPKEIKLAVQDWRGDYHRV